MFGLSVVVGSDGAWFGFTAFIRFDIVEMYSVAVFSAVIVSLSRASLFTFSATILFSYAVMCPFAYF